MAKNKVTVELSVAQAQAVNGWLAAQKSMTGFMDSLGDKSRKQKTIGQQVQANLAAWPGEIIKTVGAFGTMAVAAGAARTVVAALRAEIDRIIERSKAAQGKGVSFAERLEAVYRINPSDSNITSREIEEMILTRSGGADKGMTASMVEAAISASSTLDKRSVVMMATDLARLNPGLMRSGDTEGMKALTEGVLTAIQRGGSSFTGDITQKTEQAMGMMFGAGAAARITNLPKIASNIMGGAAKLGADYEQGAELIAAITSTAEEREGDISQTFAINMVQQLREELARVGMKDLSQSTDLKAMRAFTLSDDPRGKEVRARVLGVLEEKSQAEIDEMIRMGTMGKLTDAELSGKLKTRAKTDVAGRQFFTPGGQTTFDEFLRVAESQIKSGPEAAEFYRKQMADMAKSPILKTLHEEASRAMEKDRIDYDPLRMSAGSRQKDLELALSETDTIRGGIMSTAGAMIDKAVISTVSPMAIAAAANEGTQRNATAAGIRTLEQSTESGVTPISGLMRLGYLPITLPLEAINTVMELVNAVSGQTSTQEKQLAELRNIRERVEQNNASKIIAPRPAPAPGGNP